MFHNVVVDSKRCHGCVKVASFMKRINESFGVKKHCLAQTMAQFSSFEGQRYLDSWMLLVDCMHRSLFQLMTTTIVVCMCHTLVC